MVHDYILFSILIYIFSFFAIDISMQKMDISLKRPFIVFCSFYILFCILLLISYINIDNALLIKRINSIYNLAMPFVALYLFYFIINIQHYEKYNNKLIKTVFTSITFILSIVNIIFIYGREMQLKIFNINFNSFTFFANFLYYLFIFVFILSFLLLRRSNSNLKRDVMSSNILIFSVLLYMTFFLFMGTLLPKVYKMNPMIVNIYFSLLLIVCIHYCIRKFDLLGTNTTNLLIKTLDSSPEALCIVRNGKIKYNNSMFKKILGDENNSKLPSTNANSIFPKDFFDEDTFYNKIFNIKKFYSPEYVNVLCNKVKISDSSVYEAMEIITILDISIIQESQRKIENINKNLEKLIKESTQKLEDINNELSLEVRKRIDSENKMLEASSTDSLTGLYNRRYFSQISHNIISESNPNINRHVIIYLDLDNFKNINDTLGHSVGDEVLKEVSNRLRVSVPDTSIICRIGGDEFLIFVKNDRGSAEYLIDKISSKLLKNVREPLLIEGNTINISISIGFSIYPNAGKDIETLIRNADTAMYKSKENGKNSYSIFEKENTKAVQREFDLTNDMIMAINNEEFSLVYQPKLEFIDGKYKITGLETFIRWNHPQKGSISPDVFIPIAERSGYINNILIWILNTVCNQIKKWNEYNQDINISINFSTQKFGKENIYKNISTIIENNGIDSRRLSLEIDEQFIAKNIESFTEILNYMNNLGINVIIDHFGINYSSLNYLRTLVVNGIKIDMSFIRGIGSNIKDEAIIVSLIELCNKTGIDIIAEGVETKEECDFLLSHGLRKMQGYYFYKPMSAEEIEEIPELNLKSLK